MGMRLSSLLDQFFRRTTEADDDLSYAIDMRKSNASPPSPATISPPHRLSKPPGSIYPSRHSAPPIPPPKPTTTTAVTTTTTTTPIISTTSTSHRPPPHQPTRRLATSPRSKLKTKVRDYAFAPTDDRYIGLGPTAPKASQFPRLNKKLGGSKRARPTVSASSGRIEALPLGNNDDDDDDDESSDYPEEDEEEDDRPRIHFGPRFGAFFDSDSESDDDDRPGAGSNKGGGGAVGSGTNRGAGGRSSFSFRK